MNINQLLQSFNFINYYEELQIINYNNVRI